MRKSKHNVIRRMHCHLVSLLILSSFPDYHLRLSQRFPLSNGRTVPVNYYSHGPGVPERTLPPREHASSLANSAHGVGASLESNNSKPAERGSRLNANGRSDPALQCILGAR